MNIHKGGHKALALLRDDPTRFASQGTVVATWRTHRDRRLGPYYRLTWRENGRQRSVYLGRQGPLVDQVRSLLHEAQTARRMIREHRRRTALFRETVIRPIREYVEQVFLLFGNGLYVKGSDIGGIKNAGPRLAAADVPEHLIPEFPLPLPSFLTELQPQTNPNTNPKRERGQGAPTTHTSTKRHSPDRAIWPKPPFSPPHQHRHKRELPKSVDQNPSHCSVINLPVIHRVPSPHRHISEFPKSVDQKRLHTTRGPPSGVGCASSPLKKGTGSDPEQPNPNEYAMP